MAKQPPKKGPRMATSCKAETPAELTDRDMESKIRLFAEKAHRVIQKARGKMKPEDRERADRNANTILENASAAAKRSRREA